MVLCRPCCFPFIFQKDIFRLLCCCCCPHHRCNQRGRAVLQLPVWVMCHHSRRTRGRGVVVIVQDQSETRLRLFLFIPSRPRIFSCFFFYSVLTLTYAVRQNFVSTAKTSRPFSLPSRWIIDGLSTPLFPSFSLFSLSPPEENFRMDLFQDVLTTWLCKITCCVIQLLSTR